MSKSLNRVRRALQEAGLETEIRELGQTRTAEDAAAAVGCQLDQIAKSVILRGMETGEVLLFLTAGGKRVDPDKSAALAGEPLGLANATLIRERTGFAIGGVAPVGHLSPPRAFLDPRLLDFDLVWAAAGTPRHVFAIDPALLPSLTGAMAGDFTA